MFDDEGNPVLADPELEELLLGWALCALQPVQARYLDRLSGDLMRDGQRRHVLETLLTIARKGEEANLVTVAAALRAEGYALAMVADLARLTELYLTYHPMPDAMIESLEDCARQRVARLVKETPLRPMGSDSLAAIAETLASAPSPHAPVGTTAAKGALGVMHPSERDHRVFPTGMAHFDGQVGLAPGMLVVLGARTSVGKSACALTLAAGVARESGAPVLYHSLELPVHEQICRLVAAEAQVENWRVLRGRYNREEEVRIVRAAETVSKLSLTVRDRPGTWAEHQASYVQFAAAHPGMVLLVVDYLGLITGVQADRRYQELGIISHALKVFAQQMRCCVLAVSQLNRQATGDRQPGLQDLRESGDLEQDADVVLLLHPTGGSEDRQELACLVAKSRAGRTGTIPLWLERPFCRVVDTLP